MDEKHNAKLPAPKSRSATNIPGFQMEQTDTQENIRPGGKPTPLHRLAGSTQNGSSSRAVDVTKSVGANGVEGQSRIQTREQRRAETPAITQSEKTPTRETGNRPGMNDASRSPTDLELEVDRAAAPAKAKSKRQDAAGQSAVGSAKATKNGSKASLSDSDRAERGGRSTKKTVRKT